MAKGEQKAVARREPNLWASPFSAMRHLSDEMERLFEGMGVGGAGLPALWSRTGLEGVWSPRVDVYERKGQLVVHADLPGLTKDDVKVEATDHELLIEGERKTEREEKDEGYYRSECSYGTFRRVIRLPEGVNSSEAKANFKNGVLEVTMPAPKQPEKRSRRLEIKS